MSAEGISIGHRDSPWMKVPVKVFKNIALSSVKSLLQQSPVLLKFSLLLTSIAIGFSNFLPLALDSDILLV